MNKKSLSLLILVILASSVSASGLRMQEPDITISKMFEQDYEMVITIINDENFTFQNINFDEDFAGITPLTLQPFQNATVGLIINRDSDFTGELTLRGDYETNLGQSNKTVQIDIDYTNGLSICNIDLIIGDKIQWNNNVLDEIILTSDSDFATILEESNYTKDFNYIEEFDYYAKRNGAKFTETCRINVMDDSGWVHSLDYDYKIPSEIKITYEPTTISAQFLETEYTINYNSEREDIFSVRNTGIKPGKKMLIEAEWIKFYDSSGNELNTFDLAIGESKTIQYKIKPLIYMTNQTNKTYGIEIKISGNFEEVIKQLNITIPYAVVDSKYASSVANPDFMHDIYYFFCDLFEYDEICIRTIQSTQSTTTIEYSQETITGLLNAESKRQDEQTLYQKQDLETKQLQIEKDNETINLLKSVLEEQKNSNENIAKSNSTQKLIIVALLFIGIMFMAYNYFTSDARKDIIKGRAKLQKEELAW